MKLTQSLRWIIRLSLFGALFTPFIVDQSLFFPFIVGKGVFFRSLVEIAFAAWVILIMRDASARPKLSPIMWSFLAFTVIVGLADAFGMNFWKSFWSNFERMEGYITILHLLAYFVVVASTFTTEKLWKWFMQASVATSIIVSYYGMLQFFGDAAVNQGGVRLDSFLGNATYLAVYLVFNIFFAFILMAKEKRWYLNTAYGVVIALHFVVLYNTGTRGAMLGLIGGLFLTALLVAIFDKAEKTRRIIAISFVAIVIALVGGFVAIKNTNFVKNSAVLSRFALIGLTDTNTGARAYIWPMAIKGFEQKPILGWGQENFNYVFNANYDPHMYGQEQWFDRAHSIVFDWLINAGILGLLAYLSLWVSALYLLWKKAFETTFLEKALLTGLGAAYFVNNLFVFDNIVSYMLFAAVLAFIHFKSTRLTHHAGSSVEEADDSDMAIAASLIIICFALCFYFVNVRVYKAGEALIDGLRATSMTPADAATAIAAYQKSLSYDTVGRGEVIERLVEAVPTINNENTSLALRQQFYAFANAAIQEQLTRLPGDARYELFAGSFYIFYGMNDTALQHFEKADKLSPNKQSILYGLGSAYASVKRYDESVATFKKAYDLDQSNEAALQYYAVALVTTGHEKDAAALLKEKTGSADMTTDAFLQAYVNMGNWQKVVDILLARIKIAPKNTDVRRNLIAAYIKLGNKTAAIQAVRDLITVDGSFKTAGEDYIRQIQSGNI